MSTAPGSASRRSKKKKGSSSRPLSDLSQQKLHQSFTATSSRAVMEPVPCLVDKLEDKKDDHCSEHDVRLHGSKVQKPKKSPAVLSPGTKAEKPKIATSHTSKGTKAEKPKIATSHASNGPRPFRIIGGDPFVPGTANYKRMVADRRLQYERGQTGGVFSVCKGDPCSPDNFLKNVAGNCYGPYRCARLAYSLP